MVREISEKDAPIIQRYLNQSALEDYQCTESVETIEHLIQKSVTSCMYSPDGKPISWMVLHHSGAGICAYTIPEYRGKACNVNS